jgi:acyl carrier protein
MNDELRKQIAHRERVIERVQQLLVRSLSLSEEPDEIDPDAPLFGAGLGLDSIDAVEVVVSINREFGVELGDASSASIPLRTVNTLVDHLLAANEGAADVN